MKILGVARRYAAALLEGAADEAAARADLAALEVAGEVFGNPQARTALSSPSLEEADRDAVLHDLARAMRLPEHLARFLALVREAGRIELLPEIATTYRRLFEERYRVRRAVIEHAGEVDDALADRIRERLERITGGRIELEWVPVPGLLAGWRARVGNRLIEADLASRARRLKDRFEKGRTPWR
jgi:F-type H+-transporting ATPase subunit delta